MNRIKWGLSALALAAALGSTIAVAAPPQPDAGYRRVAAGDDIAQGRALFLRDCASCHGLNADGRGPVARALSTPPANLRLLWERTEIRCPPIRSPVSSTVAPTSGLTARAICRYGAKKSGNIRKAQETRARSRSASRS